MTTIQSTPTNRTASWGLFHGTRNRLLLRLSFFATGLLIVYLSVSEYQRRQSIPLGVRRANRNKIIIRPKNMAKENGKKQSEFPESEADNQKMRESTAHFDEVFNGNHTLTLDDLEDIADVDLPVVSWEEAARDRQPILDLLERAGLSVDVHVLQRLPTWTQVTELYGDEPVILGTETCQSFRNNVPINRRFVGVAGQMNTGRCRRCWHGPHPGCGLSGPCRRFPGKCRERPRGHRQEPQRGYHAGRQ